MFMTILVLFCLMIILQCTDHYKNVVALAWPILIIFLLKFIVYVAKVFNLMRGFCKFK